MKDIATLISECTCGSNPTPNIEKITNDLKRLVPGVIVMFSPEGALEVEPPVDYPYEEFTDEDLEKIYDYITTETNIPIDMGETDNGDEEEELEYEMDSDADWDYEDSYDQ